MSFAIETNVLLYATDASSPRHIPAANFLKNCAESGGLFCLAWPTIMAYLRIATHPKIFSAPLAPQQAEQNIQQLLTLRHCRVIDSAVIDFWQIYTVLSREYHPRGNLVPDLQLAAILKANGIKRLYTCDRDFRRFEFLEVIDPTR
ncbi:MAG: PIN domain-containing protein [Burkholderiaceae bacterium]|nr:PIN domain-containing protein [Burkholderiaceae bacterium]